ncbi:MAG: GIY-YIG nuclease family protein [Bacteroidota bacterium]|nr:GIY-YIG nuclease family protein [Bacteroidota bacterium]
MKTYFVYILQCVDGSYYTGLTNNLELRLEQHNSGTNPASYTYRRRPVFLVFNQDFSDVNQAILFEKKIKKWSAKKKKALINGDFYLLQILAECRNETHHKFKPD